MLRKASADERFRGRYPFVIGLGMLASVALHALLLLVGSAFWEPAPSSPAGETRLVILSPPERAEDLAAPPAVELPLPPEEVPRPGRPTAVETVTEPDPVFVPHDNPPLLLNSDEIRQLLRDSYPERLREEGVEGLVVLWLQVDERGQVRQIRLQRSSGQAVFDSLAREVAPRMRYRPALNRGGPVAVWVAQPFRFSIEEEGAAVAGGDGGGS